MLNAQSLGLRLNVNYQTPFVASVDLDVKLLGEEAAKNLRRSCNNKSIHQVVTNLLSDGWVIAPTNIVDYVLLTRTVELAPTGD